MGGIAAGNPGAAAGNRGAGIPEGGRVGVGILGAGTPAADIRPSDTPPALAAADTLYIHKSINKSEEKHI